MYGLWPVPFNDGWTVAPMDMSAEYDVIFCSPARDLRSGASGTGRQRLMLGICLIVFRHESSRALIQSPFSCRLEIPISISQNTYTRAKALNLFNECFRGLESPLPRTKVRGFHQRARLKPRPPRRYKPGK
jgi:hypothetical protein